METRREFLIGGAAAALGAGVARGGPIKSALGGLGNSLIEDSQGGFMNPYVTNGLVAMFDGVWNTASGSHDSSATVWEDLVGGHTVTKTGTNYSWGDNCCTFGGNTYFSIEIPEITTEQTIECVCLCTRAVATGYNCTAVANRPSGWTGRMVQINRSNDGSLTIMTPYSGQSIIQNHGIIAASILQHIGYSENGRVATAYHNGVQYGPVTYSNTSMETAVAAQPYTIGISKAAGNKFSWVGDIYSVRFYNRALAADEISANYAIDKERFNIP